MEIPYLSFLFPPSCTSSSLLYSKSPRVDPGLHRFAHDVAVGEAMIQQLLAECPVPQFYLFCRKVKITEPTSKGAYFEVGSVIKLIIVHAQRDVTIHLAGILYRRTDARLCASEDVCPPFGRDRLAVCSKIDSSVLSAVGLLFAFATLALLPQLLAATSKGRTFRLTKGDLTAEVTSNSGET